MSEQPFALIHASGHADCVGDAERDGNEHPVGHADDHPDADGYRDTDLDIDADPDADVDADLHTDLDPNPDHSTATARDRSQSEPTRAGRAHAGGVEPCERERGAAEQRQSVAWWCLPVSPRLRPRLPKAAAVSAASTAPPATPSAGRSPASPPAPACPSAFRRQSQPPRKPARKSASRRGRWPTELPSASLIETVVVAADRTLDLGLDEDRDPAAPGEQLTYTLTFGNRSAALAQMTELRLPLPPGTSFVAATGAPTVANGVVTWTPGTLAPGQGGTQQVTVQIDDGVRLGEVLAAQAEIGPTLQPQTTRASAATRVESGAPIALEAEINPDPVRPGEKFQAVLSLANRQLVDTTAQLTLRVPAQVTVFAAAFTEGGGCFGSINCAAPNHVAWEFEDVAAGMGRSVSIMPSLAAVPNGTVVPFEILLTESSGQWRRLRRSVLVEDGRDLDVGLDEDRDPAAPGDELTYTLTFGNRGAALAETTVLRLPLPPGTTFVEATGAPNVADGVVTWGVGTLLPGQGGTQQVTVKIDDGVSLGEVLVAQAEIGQVGVQINTTRATAATRMESGAPTALEAEINPDPVRPGEQFQAVLSLANRQLVDTTAQLTLRVPAQVTVFAAAFTEGGGCLGSINCAAPNHVAWEFRRRGRGDGAQRKHHAVAGDRSQRNGGAVRDPAHREFRTMAAAAAQRAGGGRPQPRPRLGRGPRPGRAGSGADVHAHLRQPQRRAGRHDRAATAAAERHELRRGQRLAHGRQRRGDVERGDTLARPGRHAARHRADRGQCCTR